MRDRVYKRYLVVWLRDGDGGLEVPDKLLALADEMIE